MTTVYGMHYSSCTHESAYALQTLHHTKAAAFKAMVAARNEWWQGRIDSERSFSGMHMPFKTHDNLIDSIRTAYSWQGWSIYEWGLE